MKQNVSLLGMPKEHDWILAASYLDKTFIRDPLAYHMSRQMGNFASRTVHCESILNDVYQGIYILQEQIKPDKNRLNITKMTSEDNEGEALTGGYIYEVAQSGENFGNRRRFKYPKGKDITQEQTNYIKRYDDAFRTVMKGTDYADSENGYAAWIDSDSFVDEVLLQEACKNSDAFGWSSYYHKDRSGKLKAGPVWDFDQALSNSVFNNGPDFTEWVTLSSERIQEAADSHPPHWRKLFYDERFQKKMVVRWNQLRKTVFKTDSLFHYIDSLASGLDEAQARNFETWNILGKSTIRSTPGFEARDTYQKEVDYLKEFLKNRLEWMDLQLVADEEVVTSLKQDDLEYKLTTFANPFSSFTIISYSLSKPGFVKLEILDLDGKHIETLVDSFQNVEDYAIQYNAQNLSDGVYFYRLIVENRIVKTKKMVVRH